MCARARFGRSSLWLIHENLDGHCCGGGGDIWLGNSSDFLLSMKDHRIICDTPPPPPFSFRLKAVFSVVGTTPYNSGNSTNCIKERVKGQLGCWPQKRTLLAPGTAGSRAMLAAPSLLSLALCPGIRHVALAGAPQPGPLLQQGGGAGVGLLCVSTLPGWRRPPSRWEPERTSRDRWRLRRSLGGGRGELDLRPARERPEAAGHWQGPRAPSERLCASAQTHRAWPPASGGPRHPRAGPGGSSLADQPLSASSPPAAAPSVGAYRPGFGASPTKGPASARRHPHPRPPRRDSAGAHRARTQNRRRTRNRRKPGRTCTQPVDFVPDRSP